MARGRFIKPDFFDDPDLCGLKPLARILFAGLWCWADREGRLEDQPARIKKNILGYDKCNADALLNDLAGIGVVSRYTVEGRAYIQIRHFLRHQKPHTREVPSTIPAQPRSGLDTAEAVPDPPNTLTRQDSNKTLTVVPEAPPGQGLDENLSTVMKAYEDLAGTITKTVADEIIEELDLGTSPEWFIEAFAESARNNIRKWSYAKSILGRWKRDGFKVDRRTNGKVGEPLTAAKRSEFAAFNDD